MKHVIQPTPSAHHRYHLLDALRGLVSVLIVSWHAPLYLHLRPGHSTYLGVDLFFCLSGFVIAFSYERRLASWMTTRQFLTARLIRLYPVYLLGMVLGIASFLIVDGASVASNLLRQLGSFALQCVMLPSYRIGDTDLLFPLNPPAWSLFFEMIANILYALAVRTKFARSRVLATVCIASWLVLLYALRTRFADLNIGWSLYPTQVLTGLARVALTFFAGVLVLRFTRSRVQPHFSPVTSAAVALTICIVLVLLLQTPLPLLRGKAVELLTVGCIMPLLVYLGSRCTVAGVWVPLCVFLGDLSYPLYLIHFPVMRLLDLPRAQAIVLASPFAQHAVVPVGIVVSGVLAWIALRLYDVPLRAALQHRYVPHRKQAA